MSYILRQTLAVYQSDVPTGQNVPITGYEDLIYCSLCEEEHTLYRTSTTRPSDSDLKASLETQYHVDGLPREL